jgi:hypothetical protein
MRIRSLSLRTVLASTIVAILATAANGGAQTSTHVGARVGYNFAREEAMFSANLTVPMTNRIEFYPSLDIYTPQTGNRMGFNGDVKIAFPMSNGPQLYAGAGVGIVNRNTRETHSTDVGANLLMGIESRTGWVHPFAEGKIQLQDRAMFQMIGGLNITLGSR